MWITSNCCKAECKERKCSVYKKLKLVTIYVSELSYTNGIISGSLDESLSEISHDIP